jgi:hypothetical protein
VIGLVVLLGGGTAFAMGVEHARTSVTIKSPAPSTFKGKVSSSNDSCVDGRAVKLLQRSSSGAKVISQGVSDSNGIWRVALEGTLHGHFYAKATIRRISSLECEADRSRAISL